MFSRLPLDRLAEFLESAWTHATLDTLFFEFELEGRDQHGNKLTRSMDLLRGVEATHENADGTVIQLIEHLFEDEWHRDHSPSLHQALQLDGFVFQIDRLVPSEPGPVALAPEISALEQAMQAQQLDVALQHYRQAVDSFTAGRLEACNGQLRSFLEALLIELDRRSTNRNVGNPSAALQDLRDNGHLDQSEWNMFRYFWHGIQDNGPHAGLTTKDEALYRLHVGTATGRYLVTKLT